MEHETSFASTRRFAAGAMGEPGEARPRTHRKHCFRPTLTLGVLSAGMHNPAEGTETRVANGAPAWNVAPAEASGGRTRGLRDLRDLET